MLATRAARDDAPQVTYRAQGDASVLVAVSYTHPTLPTIYPV